MRMSIRRFTRLTNAFSKKVANHAAAVAPWFMYYHFRRVNQTLRVTPAIEAGLGPVGAVQSRMRDGISALVTHFGTEPYHNRSF